MNPLLDPDHQPPGHVPIHCVHCGRFTSWCNPPPPPVPTRCSDCATSTSTDR